MILPMSLYCYICVLLLTLVVLTYGRPSQHALLRKRLLQHQDRQAYQGLLPRQPSHQQHHHQYHHNLHSSHKTNSHLTGKAQGRQRSRRGHVSLPSAKNRATVIWGARCSPRKAWVRPNSDVSLECEVLVPAGSLLFWKKDGIPVYSIQEFPGDVVSNAIRPNLYVDKAVGSHGTVHMSSRVYIDCAKEEDQGVYTLEVHTSSEQKSIRTFTVKLSDSVGVSVGMFCHDLGIVPYIPRIYGYTRAHMAEIGHEIVLPCHVQGYNHTITWHFQDIRLPQHSPSYKIHPNGDLVIRELSLEHRGVFACQAMSTIVPELTDISFTTVYPVVPQEEQTNEINQSAENLNV